MNKKIHVGGGGSFPYGGIFSMWAVFSLHVGAMPFFSCGGGVLFSAWVEGIIGLAPHNNFLERAIFDPPKKLAPPPASAPI